MRTTFLALGAASIALAGCTPEPVDIPEDMIEASKLCFGVQALVLRDQNGRGPDEQVTLTEYAKSIQYPMIAAAKGDDFTIESVLAIVPRDAKAFEGLADKDYESALPQCQKKFGIAGEDATPSLPEPDTEAALNCFAFSQFFLGTIEGQQVDTEGKDEYYKELAERLETNLNDKLVSDTDLLARLQSEGDAVLTEALQQAFSEGDPQGYVASCDTRFPAK